MLGDFRIAKLVGVRAKVPVSETRRRTMKRFACVLLLGLAALACSIPGRPLGGTRPPSTETGSAQARAPTASPATPTLVPATPTPLPPVITADTVGGLSVAFTFAEGIVRSLAFSPDGTVLAAAEGDPAASIGTIQLYDARSGSPLRALEGHDSAVWGLAFSPDGRYLASAGRDHTAKIWDWLRGTLVQSLNFPNEVVSVAFSPDSLTLAVGGVDELPGNSLEDAAIWTYAVDSWQPQLKLAEYWNIPDIAFSPDGSLIVGGGTSRNARVWRTSDGAEQFILYHAGQVGSIAVSPDGSTVATGLCESSEAGRCTRGAVWLWSLSSGKLIQTLSDFPAGVGGVAFSADGSLLFAASPDGMLRAYSTSDYRPLLTTTAPPGSFQVSISDMAVSPDGRYIATGGSGRIDLWRVGG